MGVDCRGRKEIKAKRTIALTANSLIALIALGARFLKLTPCTCDIASCNQSSVLNTLSNERVLVAVDFIKLIESRRLLNPCADNEAALGMEM